MLTLFSLGDKQIYDELLVDMFALVYNPTDYGTIKTSSKQMADEKIITASMGIFDTITNINIYEEGNMGAIIPPFILILFFAFVIYKLYIPFRIEICDRKKIQFFEFSLRLVNEYLCDLLEPIIGPENRNNILRFLTALLFSFQPRPPKWCNVRMTYVGGVPCRIYEPLGKRRKTDACIIYIHGGGFCIMRARYYDSTLVPIVRRLGATIISIEYQLSPEATFGKAIEQCESVVHALHDSEYQKYHIDPTRIAIFGDSAGGNLCAVLAQRALRNGRPSLFRCQVLIYPVIQMLDMLSPSYRHYYCSYKGTGLLNPRTMARWLLMYLGIEATVENIKAVLKNQHVAEIIRSNPKISSLMDYSRLPDNVKHNEDGGLISSYKYPPNQKLAAAVSEYLTNPDFSPLLGGPLNGLAPAFIATAGVDILRTEGALYARRLHDADVPVEWHDYAQAFHGVIHMPYSRQRDTIFDDVADFLRVHLSIDKTETTSL